MKRKLFACILGVACVAMTACNSAGNGGDNPSSEGSVNQEQAGQNNQANAVSPKDNPVSVRFEYEDETFKNSEGNEILYTSFVKPEVTIRDNPSATKKINAYFDAEEDKFEKAVEEYRTEAEEFYKNSGGAAPYADYVDMDVQRMDANLISFVKTEDVYLGGAHGSNIKSGITFDTRTGELLEWADLSDDGDGFYQMVKETIIRQAENHPNKDGYYHKTDTEEFAKTIEDVLNSDSWYFSKEGLVIVANPYFIGPYAAGSYYFTIPYKDLEGLKADYAYQGAYMQSVYYGQVCEIDLNGDGSPEEIKSERQVDEYGTTAIAFTINGKKMELKVAYNDGEEVALTGENNLEYYQIVDLDERDGTLQLAIGDYGPSDDPVTYFYDYKDGALVFLGYVEDLFENSTMEAYGDGILSANMPVEMIETVETNACYRLENGKITLMEQEWYAIDYSHRQEDFLEHDVLKNVTVYKEKSTASEKVILKAGEEEVRFPAADNVEWIQVQTEDGQIYYMHMADTLVIDSDGEKLDALDVFENLVLAG